MTDSAVLADLLVKAAAAWRDQDPRDVREIRRVVRKLNSPRVLSLQAIAAIVGCSGYAVRQALLPAERPTVRGSLNPKHLTLLAYGLSNGKMSTEVVQQMYREGTSINMMARLTNISPNTLKGKIHG